ncbi:MAG: hypothetical protein ACT6FE_01445 [Methanosarcinaceae archaeon]
MDAINAFGIGVLVFVLIVLLTAFYLKSASVLLFNHKQGCGCIIETQENIDGVMDDMPDNIMNDDNYTNAIETVQEEY